ncbi:MAG TPA: xanthine dehydrogenase family protein subunit M [Candidatus Acidoferrum sp.]|nr:xanthine dehydrogenase family protein subunit M [Candidatus Acidoferrum sp.]
MNRFEFARATSIAEALDLASDKPGSVLKAGGIDLLDHLKEHLREPPRIVDLKAIPGLNAIREEGDGSFRIGPLATLAQVAAHPGLRASHAALAQACGEAASPQIRNVATVGGNLLQRPRCWYYRLESYRCLKKGGDICFAVGGQNRYHAIFADGPCNAPHPSNAAVALVAFGASLTFASKQGARTVPAERFFALPGPDPQRENTLAAGEVLSQITLPAAPGLQSTYASICERAAFDWPLVSAAVALRIEGGLVREARIVLGAVATRPWRAQAAEQMLVGRRLDDATGEAAAQAALAGAQPLSENGYKVEQAKVLLRRTLAASA